MNASSNKYRGVCTMENKNQQNKQENKNQQNQQNNKNQQNKKNRENF